MNLRYLLLASLLSVGLISCFGDDDDEGSSETDETEETEEN